MAPPSDADIQSFASVTGCYDNHIASQFIQGAGGNLDLAVNNFYDNPNRYDNQSWDESSMWNNDQWTEDAFNTGRNGEDRDGGRIPSFQIHAADDSPASMHAHYDSNAPTRPPSRISMRDISPQENGILGPGGKPYFGPATKDSYDPSKWALIPSASATEIVLDVSPDERRRNLATGEPVFMKPLPNADSLPCLITILGTISLSREALGGGESTTTDYGNNPEWWKGTKIDGRPVHDHSPHLLPSYDVVEETQRLIAFLHSSNRSYGSVEPLNQLQALKDVEAGHAELKTQSDRFLTAWSNAQAVLARDTYNLFLTAATTLFGEVEEEEILFYTIEIKLGRLDEAAPPRTLYDGADEMLWAQDEDGQTDQDYYLKEVPEVLVMRVINQDSRKQGVDMEILETWYLDRYLKDNVHMAKSMRRERHKYKQQLQSIEERRKKFSHVTHPKGNKDDKGKEMTFATSDLFSGAIDYLNPPPPATEIKREDENADVDRPVDPNSIELAKQLASLYEKVEQKLKDLDIEREKTLAEMAKLSLLLTKADPENAEDPKPTHRYHLRGISTGPKYDEVYVLVDPDQAVNPGAPSQWWWINYSFNSISKEKCNIDAVLKAADAEREVILVYATDNACKPRDFDLSAPLRKFVQKDNEYFAQELAEAEAAEGDGDPPPYEEAVDAHWFEQETDDWRPDPGPHVMSDEEYRNNTDSQYANFAATSASRGHERSDAHDTHMEGIAEHIEDVVDQQE